MSGRHYMTFRVHRRDDRLYVLQDDRDPRGVEVFGEGLTEMADALCRGDTNMHLRGRNLGVSYVVGAEGIVVSSWPDGRRAVLSRACGRAHLAESLRTCVRWLDAGNQFRFHACPGEDADEGYCDAVLLDDGGPPRWGEARFRRAGPPAGITLAGSFATNVLQIVTAQGRVEGPAADVLTILQTLLCGRQLTRACPVYKRGAVTACFVGHLWGATHGDLDDAVALTDKRGGDTMCELPLCHASRLGDLLVEMSRFRQHSMTYEDETTVMGVTDLRSNNHVAL